MKTRQDAINFILNRAQDLKNGGCEVAELSSSDARELMGDMRNSLGLGYSGDWPSDWPQTEEEIIDFFKSVWG